jgi:hypothetical protein
LKFLVLVAFPLGTTHRSILFRSLLEVDTSSGRRVGREQLIANGGLTNGERSGLQKLTGSDLRKTIDQERCQGNSFCCVAHSVCFARCTRQTGSSPVYLNRWLLASL